MANPTQPYSASLTIRKILLRVVVASGLPAIAINISIGVMMLNSLHSAPTRIGADLVYTKSMRETTYILIFTSAGVSFIIASVLVISILLHHVLRLCPRKKWTVRSEFIYSIVELVFVTGYLILETFLRPQIFGSGIIGIIDAVLLWLSVVALFIIMVRDLHITKYQTLKSTYNFMENNDDVVSSWRRLGSGKWSLLFGENVFRKRFGMDRVFVRGLRAGIAIICVLAMVALAIRVLIVQPIQQEPVFKKVRTTNAWDYIYPNKNITMRLLPAIEGFFNEPWIFMSDDMDIRWLPESQPVQCDDNTIFGLTCVVPSPLFQTSPHYLIIQANYTSIPEELRISSQTNVYLDFPPNPAEISFPTTKPIPLFPGFHLLGITSYSFKDTFAGTSDLALGIPRYTHELIANIQTLLPDPEFTSLPSDNNTATLRLTYARAQSFVQPWFDVQQEQSTNTVLSGFAVLGGAWTFISGVFAMIFGCKLLLVLFGIKPLSIYGLIHVFQRRRSLADDGYILSAEEQSRTIGVLRAHLLDDDDAEANGANKECDRDEERSHLNQSTAA